MRSLRPPRSEAAALSFLDCSTLQKEKKRWKKKTVLLICTPCVGWQAKHGHRMGGGVAQSPERTGPREERTKARRCSEVDLCVAPSLPSSLTKRRLDGRFARETLVCGGGVVRERNGQPGDANHALLLRCSHFLFPRRRCAAKQF